jgi:S-adenosylmethionine-diacylgycerolhomoserine-N-methlytransferase
MMLDWAGAVRNALRMLKPDGLIGVVDFYLPTGAARLPHWKHALWRRWFGRDGVSLSDQLLPYLRDQFESNHVSEQRANIPYLPALRVPYFIFVGRRKD